MTQQDSIIQQDSYITIAEAGEGCYVESRSRFLAFALHAGSEEDVKEILAAFRKKYYDARHVCYAYVLGDHGDRTRQNDDGEPSGTAGAPLGRQLRSYGLTYTLLIVVRYFGGVKLGTSRLGVAYKAAAIEALENAEKKECIIKQRFTVSVSYPDADTAMRFIRDAEAEIVARDYTATDSILTVEIRLKSEMQLRERLSGILSLRFLEE